VHILQHDFDLTGLNCSFWQPIYLQVSFKLLLSEDPLFDS